MAKVTIDVISDVVCPWCYIGKRRLERMLELRPDLDVTVRWHPYQLDPTIPPGGLPRVEYLRKKFGSDERIAAMHERIREAGRDEGIPFAFDRIAVSPNTIDAHRLIRWAGEAGVQDAVKESLMRGYFTEGANLADHATLAALAARGGLPEAGLAARLATDEDRDAVTAEVAHAQAIGVSGVPFFILESRIGVSGAQPPDVLSQAVDEAIRHAA